MLAAGLCIGGAQKQQEISRLCLLASDHCYLVEQLARLHGPPGLVFGGELEDMND
jgi:hypothetical protein